MEAILWAWVVASNPRRIGLIQLQFCFTFATIFAAIFATIAPRSDRDRASIVVLVLLQSPPVRPATIPRRNLLDCGSIAPRSQFDRVAIVQFFHTLPTPSDRNPTLHRSSRIGILLAVRSESYAPVGSMKPGRLDGLDCAITWPSDGDRVVLVSTKIGRSRRVHVAKGKPCDHFTYDVF